MPSVPHSLTRLVRSAGSANTGRLLAVATVGYVVGSIPVANTVARRHGAPDLRTTGDGNPGYWNAKETLGARDARAVFVGDVAKGAVAAGLAKAVAPRGAWWYPYVGGGAAMAGHAFPAGMGFRGGKSVLTFVGTMLVAAPQPAAVSVAVTGATWAATGRFDRAAQVGVASFPFVQFVLQGRYRTAATGVLMTFVGLRFAASAKGEKN